MGGEGWAAASRSAAASPRGESSLGLELDFLSHLRLRLRLRAPSGERGEEEERRESGRGAEPLLFDIFHRLALRSFRFLCFFQAQRLLRLLLLSH
jgi:hypothetical protein